MDSKNTFMTQFELIFQDECCIKDLLTKKLVQSENESKEIQSLILEKKNELDLLEKLHSLINESINKNKNILELFNGISKESTNDITKKLDENNDAFDSFSYEEEEEEPALPSQIKQHSTSITSENLNNNKNNDNNHEMMIDDMDENIPKNVNIPLESSKSSISDPRLSNPKYLNKNEKSKDLLTVNYSTQNQLYSEPVKNSEIIEQKPTPSLPSNLPALLSLNLNLPSSISSILFQGTSNIKETNENNVKPAEITSNRDPRLKANPICKTIINSQNNHSQTSINVHKEQSPSKISNPIFNKIQQVIKEGFTNQNSIKKPNKNVYVIENNGVRITRTKPAPNYMDKEGPKSELVKLYEVEPFEHDFTKLIKEKNDWIIIDKSNRIIKNPRLENIIQNRNQFMINKLNDDIIEELKNNEKDLLTDMKMLMNYDFCNNKHMINKKKAKKSKDETKKKFNSKPEIQNNILSDLIVDFVNENENNQHLQTEKNNEIDEDDLYGDLNNVCEINQEEDYNLLDNFDLLQENKIKNDDKILKKDEKINLNNSDSKENNNNNNNNNHNNSRKQQNDNKNKDKDEERKASISSIENKNRKYEKNNYRSRDRRSRSRSNSRKRSRSISRNRSDSKRTYSNDTRNNCNKKRYDKEDDYNKRNKKLSPFRDSSRYSSNSTSKGSYKNNEDKNSKRIRTD